MSNLKKYKFSSLYEMSSGISSTPEQAGHGSPFASFSTVFNNYFLPDELPDLMETSNQERETYSIRNGDILLTRTSETIDELAISSVALKDYPEATYSGFVKRLRPTQTDITYPKFMAFYLRSKSFRKTMTDNAVMTLRASLNEDIFSYLDLLLLDYESQIRAGDLLYLFESKILTNKKINCELDELAKAIYNYYFVQFNFPDSEGKPYKESGGQMEFNAELKREIPKGWKLKSLYQIAKYRNGLAMQKHRPISEKQLPVIKIREMNEGFSSGTEYARHDIDSNYIINEGDVLFSWSASLNIMVWANRPGALNQHIFKVTSDEYPRYFYYYQLANYLNHFKLMAENRKTTMGHITIEHLKESKIVVPNDDSLIKRCGEEIEPLLNLIVKNNMQNHELAHLRDFLLPLLMNGQVKIK